MDMGADMPSRDEFAGHLHDALKHLYEPHVLRRNALAGLFGVANRADTPSALQRILVEAVQSLRPPPNEPPRSRAWEVYIPLSYRYVERCSPAQIADQMSISVRHLRRKEHEALQALANLLWDRYSLASLSAAEPETAAPIEPAHGEPAAIEGLEWVKDSVHGSRTDPDQILPDALQLAHRLAERHAVRLEAAMPRGLPSLAIDHVALRQVLFSLITVVMPRASGGVVAFTGAAQRWEVEFRLHCLSYPSGPKPTLDGEANNLNLAQQLAQLSMATLNLSIDARAFDARLAVPTLERLPVLVIDDHEDTLQLLQRYAVGTRYRLIATRDSAQALRLAEEHSPQIIVLDVIMPGADGWEVMAQLQQSPLTSHIPVVVCTIAAQRDLALLLGASTFLRKPVSRPAFLAALDQLVHPAAGEPR